MYKLIQHWCYIQDVKVTSMLRQLGNECLETQQIPLFQRQSWKSSHHFWRPPVCWSHFTSHGIITNKMNKITVEKKTWTMWTLTHILWDLVLGSNFFLRIFFPDWLVSVCLSLKYGMHKIGRWCFLKSWNTTWKTLKRLNFAFEHHLLWL